MAADLVAHRVAYHRAHHRHRHHHPQVGLALGGEEPADQQGGLARDHETDHGRRLQQCQHTDDHVAPRRGQTAETIEQAGDHEGPEIKGWRQGRQS